MTNQGSGNLMEGLYNFFDVFKTRGTASNTNTSSSKDDREESLASVLGLENESEKEIANHGVEPMHTEPFPTLDADSPFNTQTITSIVEENNNNHQSQNTENATTNTTADSNNNNNDNGVTLNANQQNENNNNNNNNNNESSSSTSKNNYNWVGSPVLTEYHSFQHRGTTYTVGDCVYMNSPKNHPHYIARIVRLIENRKGEKRAFVKWFYRPHDTKRPPSGTHEREIFLSSIIDENPISLILGKCFVKHGTYMGSGGKSRGILAWLKGGNDRYFFRRFYNEEEQEFLEANDDALSDMGGDSESSSDSDSESDESEIDIENEGEEGESESDEENKGKNKTKSKPRRKRKRTFYSPKKKTTPTSSTVTTTTKTKPSKTKTTTPLRSASKKQTKKSTPHEASTPTSNNNNSIDTPVTNLSFSDLLDSVNSIPPSVILSANFPNKPQPSPSKNTNLEKRKRESHKNNTPLQTNPEESVTSTPVQQIDDSQTTTATTTPKTKSTKKTTTPKQKTSSKKKTDTPSSPADYSLTPRRSSRETKPVSPMNISDPHAINISKKSNKKGPIKLKKEKQLGVKFLNLIQGTTDQYNGFILDGVEYRLNDHALFTPGFSEQDPFIGKIISISKTEVVGVQWYYRAEETNKSRKRSIEEDDVDILSLEREIFGSSDSNYNSIGTIEGKCNVIYCDETWTTEKIDEYIAAGPHNYFFRKWYDGVRRVFMDTEPKVEKKGTILHLDDSDTSTSGQRSLTNKRKKTTENETTETSSSNTNEENNHTISSPNLSPSPTPNLVTETTLPTNTN